MLPARIIQDATSAQFALALAAGAAASVGGAWAFEWAGYAPCDLCLQQRWAYYAGVPMALATAGLAQAKLRAPTLIGFLLLAAAFSANAAFGAWHAGVEWGWWRGPTGCTGAFAPTGDMGDFMRSMESARLVRCDEPALRIIGLSLAGWNAIVSAGLVSLALLGVRAR